MLVQSSLHQKLSTHAHLQLTSCEIGLRAAPQLEGENWVSQEGSTLFYLKKFLPMPCGMWNLNSPTGPPGKSLLGGFQTNVTNLMNLSQV